MRKDIAVTLQRASVVLVMLALLSCVGDTSEPEAGDPSDAPASPSDVDRTLPTGTYDVTYTACRECDSGVVPDYLLALSDGMSGVVEISDADASTATLRLVDMRRVGDGSDDALALFRELVVVLRWSDAHSAFRGTVDYGAAAQFTPVFRRADEGLDCDLALFHAKHDVGTTTCRASPRAR